MLISAILFLIQTIFDLYIYIVLLRFLLQTIHADYFNPLSQFSIKFTRWIVKPLQKVIPEVKRIDLAILFLLFALEIIKLLILISIQTESFPNILGVLVLSFANLLNKLLMFYFYAIIIRVILSWVTSVHHNPVFFALHQLTEPVLKPLRRIIPVLGGFDLSPLLALILTQLLSLVLVTPLMQLAVPLL